MGLKSVFLFGAGSFATLFSILAEQAEQVIPVMSNCSFCKIIPSFFAAGSKHSTERICADEKAAASVGVVYHSIVLHIYGAYDGVDTSGGAARHGKCDEFCIYAVSIVDSGTKTDSS